MLATDGSLKNFEEGRSVDPLWTGSSDVSILVFNPHLDEAERLADLGYTVTETDDTGQLTRHHLQNFNVLFIGSKTDPALYTPRRNDILNWVRRDGGGLIVAQPDRDQTEIPLFPEEFKIMVSMAQTGQYGVRIVSPEHPIFFQLEAGDLSGNFDLVRREGIGPQWQVLAVARDDPGQVALLAARFGSGRFLFSTGLMATPCLQPGSDRFWVQTINWAGTSPVVVETPALRPWMIFFLGLCLLLLGLRPLLRRRRSRGAD